MTDPPGTSSKKRLNTRWCGIEVVSHPRAPNNGPRVWTVLLRVGHKAAVTGPEGTNPRKSRQIAAGLLHIGVGVVLLAVAARMFWGLVA